MLLRCILGFSILSSACGGAGVEVRNLVAEIVAPVPVAFFDTARRHGVIPRVTQAERRTRLEQMFMEEAELAARWR